MRKQKDQYFFVDLLGFIIFGALLCTVLAAGVGAFWLVFCHPGSKMVELIPFLRPARILVTCILAFSAYQFLANPASGEHPSSRFLELIAILLVSAGLGAVRFFYGTGDGSTLMDLLLDTAVRWSMCLGLAVPMAVFALLGYRAGGRTNHAGSPSSDGGLTERVAPSVTKSRRLNLLAEVQTSTRWCLRRLRRPERLLS